LFFYLSKIFWFLTAPLNLFFVLLGAAWLLFAFHKYRAARLMVVPALLLFIAGGLSPAGYNMLVWLEAQYPRAEAPAQINGAIILGGSFDTDVTIRRKVPSMNDSSERVLAAVQLQKLYPGAQIIFSGGNGALDGGGRPESEDVKSFFAYGFDASAVRYEKKSRNTFENLAFSKALLKPQDGQTWLLVTSAWHLPRAMIVAKKAGWKLTPWPVDYRTDGKYRMWPERLDILGHFYDMQVAWHELIGIAVYRMTDKG
jgi:uncharacterized SAM-binding protein YcdF (DUF218 family)